MDNMSQPNYYWVQSDWNQYTLLGDSGEALVFKTYDELYQYCKKNNINAKQV